MPVRADWKPAWLAVLAALAAYAGTLSGGYVWDDEAIVLAAPRPLAEVLLSPDEVAPYYRPLTRLSFLVVDRTLFGLDPRASHALNVSLHAGCTLLLYLLALRLFRSVTPALLAALLLAVHPLHAEAVAFVTARNNLLALLFCLAAVLLFLGGRIVLSGVATFLALCSKEQGAVALPMIAASALSLREAPRSWRRLVPQALALAAYLALRAVALHGAPRAEGLRADVGSALSGIASYLRLVVWPADLTIFHPEPVPSWRDGIPWLALVGLMAWLLRRPSPASRFGALWLVCALLPLSGVVPVPSATVAERYVYAVLPGLWILLADAGTRIPKKVGWALAAIVLTACAVRTVARTRDWKDDVSLARSAVAVDPRSGPARYNLGVALKDAGDLPGAEAQWRQALRLRPDDAETLTQLATAAAVRGDLMGAEELLRSALKIRPDLAMAARNLAVICERTGRAEEAQRLRRSGR
ncbi:MAG TPA: tetratricopeptide repeat protein [Candidatus Polarisedimenticolaceae bacterium]|nr:tetratricopeptide repeat protein [Candidatus Polarisedimenticolaceae bacterium]